MSKMRLLGMGLFGIGSGLVWQFSADVGNGVVAMPRLLILAFCAISLLLAGVYLETRSGVKDYHQPKA